MSFEMATELRPHWHLRQVQLRLLQHAMRREDRIARSVQGGQGRHRRRRHVWLLCLDGPTLIHRHTVLSWPELAGLDALSSLPTSRQPGIDPRRRWRQRSVGKYPDFSATV